MDLHNSLEEIRSEFVQMFLKHNLPILTPEFCLNLREQKRHEYLKKIEDFMIDVRNGTVVIVQEKFERTMRCRGKWSECVFGEV